MGSIDSLKRAIAGLLIMAILALSGGQSLAMQSIVGQPCSEAHTGATQAHAARGHSMSYRVRIPDNHRDGVHGPACCIASDCPTVPSGILVGAAARLLPARRGTTYDARIVSQFDGIGALPALPPPRHWV